MRERWEFRFGYTEFEMSQNSDGRVDIQVWNFQGRARFCGLEAYTNLGAFLKKDNAKLHINQTRERPRNVSSLYQLYKKAAL